MIEFSKVEKFRYQRDKYTNLFTLLNVKDIKEEESGVLTILSNLSDYKVNPHIENHAILQRLL